MFERIKNSKFAKKIGIVVASVAMLAVSAFAASAEEPVSANISDTLVSSFSSVTSDMTATITGILPYVLGLVGLGLAITLGIKYFKKLAGKAG